MFSTIWRIRSMLYTRNVKDSKKAFSCQEVALCIWWNTFGDAWIHSGHRMLEQLESSPCINPSCEKVDNIHSSKQSFFRENEWQLHTITMCGGTWLPHERTTQQSNTVYTAWERFRPRWAMRNNPKNHWFCAYHIWHRKALRMHSTSMSWETASCDVPVNYLISNNQCFKDE